MSELQEKIKALKEKAGGKSQVDLETLLDATAKSLKREREKQVSDLEHRRVETKQLLDAFAKLETVLTGIQEKIAAPDFDAYLQKQVELYEQSKSESAKVIAGMLTEIKYAVSRQQEPQPQPEIQVIDYQKIEKSFQAAIHSLVKVLVPQNEEPAVTNIRRNRNGKPEVITEVYEGYVLERTFTYDSAGRLERVQTIKR